MKITGYIVALIGLVGVLLKTDMAKKLLVGITLPPITQTNTFLIGSLIVVAIGIALVTMTGGASTSRRGKNATGAEVPIYQGNQIVGYRRI